MKNITGVVCCILVGICIICSSANAKNDKQKSIPPGLQKKVERGKELPPGWQKKIARGEVLDARLYEHGTVLVPVDKNGISTIKIEDKIIRLIDSTREIVEILD